MSLFTRRLIAFGLLFAVAVSVLDMIVVPVAALVHDRLLELSDVRFQRAQLDAVLARPAPPHLAPMPSGSLILASTAALARQQLAALIQSDAASTGVRLTSLGPGRATSDGAVHAEIVAEGAELSVVSFLNHLERGRPLARMRAWKLVKAEGTDDALRLSGEVMAAWGQQP